MNVSLVGNSTVLSAVDIAKLLATAPFGVIKEAPVAKQELVKPARNLRIKLNGTILIGDESVAMIETAPGKPQELFRVGDTVVSGVVLDEIMAERIIIKRNGQREEVWLTNTTPGKSNASRSSSNAFPSDTSVRSLSRSVVNTQMNDLGSLMSQARMIPHFKGGKSVGLRVNQIVPGSLYEQAGLVNGDIVKSVNGQSVTNPQQLMRLYQSLKNESNVSISIERGGQMQTIGVRLN